MFKMRHSLLPVVLLTTITLSSSNVLPILSINKLDTDSSLDDQDTDNTFNNKHTNNINPNIFYKVFIGTSKENLPKKYQVARLKYFDNDNNIDRNIHNGQIDAENNYDDEGFRKEQWHNYPRQLDRLNNNLYLNKQLQEILDIDKLKKVKRPDNLGDVYNYKSDDVYGNTDTDVISGPLLVLKIRLALTNNKNADVEKYLYTDLVPLESTTDYDGERTKNEDAFIDNNNTSVVKVKRGKLSREDINFLENSSSERKSVKKRIFSLWSRLQSLSHRGHELHHRRHLYAFYGLPEEGGGTLTAETRATLMRPPGSPLRWG